jgi:Rrf2 family protein
MKLSNASGYAIRALAHLARHGDGRLVTTAAIAEAEGLPERFLADVLNPLARAGVLDSSRGPCGGFRLARPAKSVTLLEVVEAVEGPVRGLAPPEGGTPEGRRFDKRLQAACEKSAETVRGQLRRVSLADLAWGVVLLNGRAATSPAARSGGSRSGNGTGAPAVAGPATPAGGVASGARRPRSSAGRRGRALGVERKA